MATVENRIFRPLREACQERLTPFALAETNDSTDTAMISRKRERVRNEVTTVPEAGSVVLTMLISNRVKVGILGLGRWAKVLTRAARASNAIEIVQGFSRSEQSRVGFQAEFGVKATS